MKLRILAGLLAGGWLLATLGCSDESASFQPAGAGGTESGGNGGAAQAGTTSKAGSSASGGSATGKAGSANGGTSSGGTSNHDQPDCETDLAALDRSCTTAEDCALVEHQIDCCGTTLGMGLNGSQQAAFAALEQYCSAQFPLCECAPQGIKLEDGSVVDFASAARVECVDQRCRSRSDGETTACGDKKCTAQQYCSQFLGGVPDSQPSYTCTPLGDCADCDCLSVSPACQCSGSGSAIKVFCAAP